MPSFTLLLLLCASAFAAPTGAIEHRWANASKEAVGTSYGRTSSNVWYTVSKGILTEVYYPQIDRAQVGDSQLLFVVGDDFLEEKRDFTHEISHPPLFPRTVVRAQAGQKGEQIAFSKEILTDPKSPVVRVRYRFMTLPEGTKVFLLHKPAADNDGGHDRGRVLRSRNGASAFVVWDDESTDKTYQVVLASAPMARTSVGVVGESDGWQDLSRHGRMVNEIQTNGPGSLAFTAELNVTGREVEIAIGFGDSPEEALSATSESIKARFDAVREEFDAGWARYVTRLGETPWLKTLPTKLQNELIWDAVVIKAHEDKLNPGAIVASLSIPNLPEGKGAPDGKNTGGYHLIWPRDLFKSALAMLRLGDTATAHNVLRYMTRMEHDGKMAQNAWVNGRQFWTVQQMDQEAFPALLAYELEAAGVALDDDLKAFVQRRLHQIRQSDGYTQQERWEEERGFSPNSIAVMAAALSRSGDHEGARRFLRIALEKTVARSGPLSSKPYFLRITQHGHPDAGEPIEINNGGPTMPENKLLDGGFLEWARWFPAPKQYFGELGAELVTVLRNTLPVYDNPVNGVAVRLDGVVPLYRRYNSDAYGYHGVGGPWPILSLERVLPDLGANPDLGLKFINGVRALYGPGDLCPEQVDRQLRPMPHAAGPLVWCHAEMIELAHKSVVLKKSRVKN